jgi:dual specificity tyrosine-phosphorylation-regulated kinase 2/3/4
VLEIITGIPLWMSLKTIIEIDGKELIKYGLFAVQGRHFEKIIQKQFQVLQRLDHVLENENYSGIVIDL